MISGVTGHYKMVIKYELGEFSIEIHLYNCVLSLQQAVDCRCELERLERHGEREKKKVRGLKRTTTRGTWSCGGGTRERRVTNGMVK